MTTTHKVYCWKSGNSYYLSLRSVRQPKNSVETSKYKTRGGRNKRVNKIIEQYKGKAAILRNTKP